MGEGERERFWRERFQEANREAFELKEENLELRWEVEQIQKDLNNARQRLRNAEEWWRKRPNK